MSFWSSRSFSHRYHSYVFLGAFDPFTANGPTRCRKTCRILHLHRVAIVVMIPVFKVSSEQVCGSYVTALSLAHTLDVVSLIYESSGSSKVRQYVPPGSRQSIVHYTWNLRMAKRVAIFSCIVRS